MRSQTEIDLSEGYFKPHPNLSDEINANICRSDIEGGVFLQRLPIGTHLEVQTKNHLYWIDNRGDGLVRIAGHPEFCPFPVLVRLHGSTWGGAMIREHFIGRGMFLEFRHAVHGIIRTSCICEIRELPEPGIGLYGF